MSHHPTKCRLSALGIWPQTSSSLALVYLAFSLGLFSDQRAYSWWIKGHGILTQAAVSALPEDVPMFFRAAAKELAYLAGDPDRWKNPETPALRTSESPEHYIDLEDYNNQPLPANRYEAIALLQRLKRRPERAGLLPWAIQEHYERLTCAFADLRRQPEEAANRTKCIVYAGILAHYAQDAAMPLHTTRDYDGRRSPDGKWLQKGIHAKIDGFPETHNITAEEIARHLQAKTQPDIWLYIMQVIQESHKQVDRCYELDADGAFDKPTEDSRAFILARCRVAAQFTLDLWYNAWKRSEKLPPPFPGAP
ncbi:MAG: hypothetical protein RMI91_00140 [Gemmatales bacterium]|nr:hypothetical protein [Gemmatales bacterium]MDW7993042.1 hypothetical protein [Gemmatales bacterium]